MYAIRSYYAATESTGDSNTPSSPSDTVRIIKDYYGNDNKNIWHEKRATWSTSASNGKGGWVLNGITKEYYQSPANTLASEATYVNGKREGLTTKYYPSGKKYIVWNYVAVITSYSIHYTKLYEVHGYDCADHECSDLHHQIHGDVQHPENLYL